MNFKYTHIDLHLILKVITRQNNNDALKVFFDAPIYNGNSISMGLNAE